MVLYRTTPCKRGLQGVFYELLIKTVLYKFCQEFLVADMLFELIVNVLEFINIYWGILI